MRLISLHVENFGKLQNYDDTFDAGLNARLQDNGWGKSTLAVFIKAMLYGLAATTRRSLIENERKRYTPWQGGAFGGSLDIEVEGKCYRIERLFGAKEAEDTLTVTDLMTGRDADVDWASEPGERLLGVDSAAYERSTYLSQRPDELSESGMIDKVDIVYIVEDNEELCRDKIQKLIDGGCDLLYTIGRYASETAADITKDIPIVFGAVNSPDEVGLVESNEAPGGNVTGVSSYTPCFEQIDLIKIILPEAKSVAAIYTSTDADSVLQGIVASKEAEKNKIKCDQYPVENEKALKTALEKIKKAETDVIYIPVDKFLSAHISTLNEFSYENKIPVICGDEATLELGAFATSEINYISIGRKAAGMAEDILFNGKSPATLSVNYKHDCTNMVNKQVMKKLGITLPATALTEVEMWEPPTEPATQAPTKAPAGDDEEADSEESD